MNRFLKMFLLLSSICVLLWVSSCSNVSEVDAGAVPMPNVQAPALPVRIDAPEVIPEEPLPPLGIRLGSYVDGALLVTRITYLGGIDENDLHTVPMPSGLIQEGWVAYEGDLARDQTIVMEPVTINMLRGMYFLPIKEYTREVRIPIDYLTQSGIDLRCVEISVNIEGMRAKTLINLSGNMYVDWTRIMEVK